MTEILNFIIIILILGIIFQRYYYKKKHMDLINVIEGLKKIIDDKSREKIMVLTGNKDIQDLINQINILLEYNHKITAGHIRNENSIKKMLSNISHDLKTPLTVILGYSEVLIEREDIASVETKELILKLENKTKELIDFINEFFDLAKLESGDTKIINSTINISEICRRRILSFYEVFQNKGIELSLNIPEENFYGSCNEEALERVLDNLIGNSIKYGIDGKIIGLDLETDEKYIYINVWDKGKGIDEIDKVFERLYTLEDSRNKRYQGSGLGLTITKRLVERMNGEISLESVPYEKTVFSIKLIKKFVRFK